MAENKVKAVKLDEKKTVYSTGKNRYYAAGDAITAHPLLAEKLIKAGKATEKAPK
jgi:hypothetical protein